MLRTGEHAMKPRFLKPFRQTAGTREQVNHRVVDTICLILRYKIQA